jgi:nicotinamide riboside kinase
VLPLGFDDVPPIARAQVAAEDAAAAAALAGGNPLVVRDTDLVSTVVYARHYYGACPPWVEAAARARRAGLYLLCDVDVPWVAEGGQRDPSGADPRVRAALRDAFAAALAELGCDVVRVRGPWRERERAALEAVRALVAAPQNGSRAVTATWRGARM